MHTSTILSTLTSRSLVSSTTNIELPTLPPRTSATWWTSGRQGCSTPSGTFFHTFSTPCQHPVQTLSTPYPRHVQTLFTTSTPSSQIGGMVEKRTTRLLNAATTLLHYYTTTTRLCYYGNSSRHPTNHTTLFSRIGDMVDTRTARLLNARLQPYTLTPTSLRIQGSAPYHHA